MVDRTLFTATGYAAENLPAGTEREEIIVLIRLGAKFRSQHVGKRRGFLHNYLDSVVARMAEPLTFDALLGELELAAVRRSADDGEAVPVEQVSRSFCLLTYHDPKRGRLQVTFGRLKNIFTEAKRDKSR